MWQTVTQSTLERIHALDIYFEIEQKGDTMKVFPAPRLFGNNTTVWKYTVGLNVAFLIQRPRNFCIFCGRRRGRGKTLMAKIC